MTYVYATIVTLAVYADLVKWFLPPDAALAVIYSAAAAILAAIAIRGRATPLRKDTRLVGALAGILVASYIIQGLTSLNVPHASSITAAVYVAVPLAYIIVVVHYCPEFDLPQLGRLFLVAMLPVNAIGAVQYFFDPSFMVLSGYSEDSAIILRNLIDGETFARYPSIYASADRYSSLALMQFYFAFVLLVGEVRPSPRMSIWLAANIAASLVALFIAGARSRVIIAGSELAFFCAALVFSVGTARRLTGKSKATAAAAVAVILAIAAVFWLDPQLASDFPVLRLLHHSVDEGEISERLSDAIAISTLRDEVSLFGDGLGTASVGGRPGEFGIMTIWTESGLVWGMIMLTCFVGMIALLTARSLRAFIRRQPVRAVIDLHPALLLIFALLAGLTSSLELSTGILLGCSIAWTMRNGAQRAPLRGAMSPRISQMGARQATRYVSSRQW